LQVKKAVCEAVKTKLQDEQTRIRATLRENKRAFKRLTEAQTVLKRELVIFSNLIRSLSD